MSSIVVDLDVALEVEYTIDEEPSGGRINPIDLISAKMRGTDILPIMHIGHIMTLQRRIYNRELDKQFDAEQGDSNRG